MRGYRLAALVIGLAAAGAVTTASAADATNVFRFTVGQMSATSEYEVPGLRAKFDSGFGVGVDYEYRVSDRFGVALGVKYLQPDVVVRRVDGAVEDSTTVMPLTLGALFHLTPNKWFDVYAGPQVAYVNYGNVHFPNGTGAEFESEVTWGVRLGVGIPYGDRWAFEASVEYLAATAEVTDSSPTIELDPSPVLVNVGFSYRF